MPEQTPPVSNTVTEKTHTIDTLHVLIEKQSTQINKLVEDNKKIKRRLFFIALGGNIRLILVLVPLLLTLALVVPFLKQNWEGVQTFLQIVQPDNNQSGGSFIENIAKDGFSMSSMIQEFQRVRAEK